jgi:hypothetical protein
LDGVKNNTMVNWLGKEVKVCEEREQGETKNQMNKKKGVFNQQRERERPTS